VHIIFVVTSVKSVLRGCDWVARCSGLTMGMRVESEDSTFKLLCDYQRRAGAGTRKHLSVSNDGLSNVRNDYST